MLERVRMVLIQTSHPGNIGAAARAMKTMGLQQLYLVAPQQFPHDKARELASGAADILDAAVVVETLSAAIADCSFIVGTSARSRRIPWPHQNPRQVAQQLTELPSHTNIAILFGRERIGLTNEELERCHLHLQIPANPVYSSLNLAAAVQLIAYELYLTQQTENANQSECGWDYPLATAAEMEFFYTHLEKVLAEIRFLKLTAPRKLMTRFKRLFNRTRPDAMEVNMLRGMLTAVEDTIKKGR